MSNEYETLTVPNQDDSQYNEYDAIAAQEKSVAKQELKAARYIADRTTPERQAQYLELSKKTNLPVEVVERNYEDVAKLPEADQTDYDSLLETNPKLTEYLRKPENYALSKDDVDGLKKIEDVHNDYGVLSAMYDGLYSGVASLHAGLARLPGTAGRFIYKPQNLIADAFDIPSLKVEIRDDQINTETAKFFDDLAKKSAPKELSGNIIEEFGKGNYARAGRLAAVQAANNVPLLGVMIGLGPVAGPALGGAVATANKLSENIEKGIDPGRAEASALLEGAYETLFERLGTFGILKKWGDVIESSFGKQALKQWKTEFAKTLGYSIVVEGAEEGATQIAQDVTDHLLGIEQYTGKQMLERAGNAAILGGIMGGGMVSPAGVALRMQSQQAKKDAQLAKDMLLALGNGLNESKTKSRLPDKAREYIETVTKDGPVKDVYVSPEALQTYFQSKNSNAVSEMQKAGLSKEFDQAIENGTDVKIPLATFVDKFGGEHFQGLANDVKFDPGKLSVNEAKAQEEQLKEDLATLEKAAKEGTDAELTTEQAAKQVGGEVAQQLVAAGKDPRQAIVFERFYNSFGKRLGVNPVDLFNEFRLQIDPNTVQVEDPAGAEKVYNQAPRPLDFKPYVSPLGFYSQVEAEVGKMDFKSMPSKDLSNRIKNIAGLKKEELEWIGVNDWLEAEDRKVSKEEVVNFIRSNGIQVTQTVLAESYNGPEDPDSEADWGAPRRNHENDYDDIQNELEYYGSEDFWDKERLADLRNELAPDHTDENGEIDEAALEKAIEETKEERAEEYARESVESDDYSGARFTVEERTTGEYLDGSDEMGWYSSTYGDMGYNLEEAKIQLVGRLIEDGKLGGSVADLIKAEDLTWDSSPSQLNRDEDKIDKLVKKYFKEHKEELIKTELTEDAGYYEGKDLNDKEVKKQIKKFAEGRARAIVQDQLTDPANPDNNIFVRLDNDFLGARIERKNGNWFFRFKNKSKQEKAIDLEAKDIDAAKAEAIKQLLDRGLITSKTQLPSAQEGVDVNAPTGSSKWSDYKVDGGENYREILLTLPERSDGENFQYRTHFDQKNILAHVRLTDRVDAEGKKVLFVEEMQSDWHQQGRAMGYKTKEDKAKLEELRKKKADLLDKSYEAKEKWDAAEKESKATYDGLIFEINKQVAKALKLGKGISLQSIPNDLADFLITDFNSPALTEKDKADKIKGFSIDLGNTSFDDAASALVLETLKHSKITKWKDAYLKENEIANKLSSEYHNLKQQISDVDAEQGLLSGAKPDAPFKGMEAWTRLGLKRIIRLAAEQGYDSVGITPGSVHTGRWGTNYVTWQKLPDGKFEVGYANIRGGEVNGMNLEDTATQRGLLKKASGVIVGDLKELADAISGAFDDSDDGKVEDNVLRVWEAMQKEGAGIITPRKSFYESLYDRNIAKKSAQEVLKKLDKSAKVEVGKIDTKEGRQFRIELNEAETQHAGVDMYDAIDKRNGVVAFTGDEKSLNKYIEEESGRMSVWKINLTDQIKNKVMEGQTLFQDSEQHRGQLRLEAQRAVMAFGKSSDRSTFFHETGHFFLEVLRRQAEKADAPQQIKDDYNTILKWFGITDSSQLTREHHEKWAEGVEDYFLKGKAPSSALRRAFATFRVWLVDVYKSLRGLRVEFSTEVKEVMDRLLATDEEIEAARAEQRMEPLFGDPKTVGMTDKQAMDYLNATFDAEEEAKTAINNKAMKHLTKEAKKARKEEFTAIRPEIEAEVNQRPIYLSMSKIEENPQLKISRESLKAFGEDVHKSIPKKIVAKKGEGMDINLVADIVGYSSAQQFVTDLINAKDKTKLIDEITNQEVERRNPELASLANLTDEAKKAIHNRKRAQVLRMEFEHLASNYQSVFKNLTKRMIKRMPSEAVMQEQARAQIASIPANEIRPNLYLRAERKAASNTADLFTKGDFDGAINSKRIELLNHELFRAASDAQEQVEKADALIKRVFKKDDDIAKYRDLDLVYAARAILGNYGYGEQAKDAIDYLNQLKRQDRDTYDTILNLVEAAGSPADPANPTYGELIGAIETVKTLWSMARENKTLVVDGKRIEKQVALAEMSAQVSDLVKPGAFKTKYEGEVTSWEKAKLTLMGLRAKLRRVESWVDAVDEGKPNGPFRKYLWKPIKDAANKYRDAKRVKLKELAQILEANKDLFTTDEIAAPELGDVIFKGKVELLGALLHTGNESNLKKLLVGRGYGYIDSEGNLNSDAWNKFLTRMYESGTLQARDYEFVQSFWDYMETLKPEAWAAHKNMYGFFPNEVTADQIVTPFGTYKGGYAPAVADPFRSTEGQRREDRRTVERETNSYTFPTTGRGWAKNRVENYATPLSIDLRLVLSHVDKVLRFTHIEPAVKTVGKLVADKEFRAMIDAFDPAVVSEMLAPWLARTALQSVETRSTGFGGRGIDNFFSKVRSRTGLQMMGLNFINAMQNMTGLSMAALKVSPFKLKSAFYRYITDRKQMVADISEKSSFMRNRLDNQMRDAAEQMDAILLAKGDTEKVVDWAVKHARFMASATQNLNDIIAWNAAYDEAVEGGAKEADAVEQADSVVRLTQGSMDAEDVAFANTGTPFVRMFTMFYDYFNMQANVLGTEFVKIQRDMGLRKGLGKALYVYTMGFMVPAFVGSVIFKGLAGSDFDDDDDGSQIDDLLSLYFGSQFQTLTAFVPGVGQAVNLALVNRFNDKVYDDRLNLSPAITAIEGSAGVLYGGYKLITDEGNPKRFTKDFLTLLGLVTGLPTAPLSKPINYAIDLSEGDARPEGLLAPLEIGRGLLTGKNER